MNITELKALCESATEGPWKLKTITDKDYTCTSMWQSDGFGNMMLSDAAYDETCCDLSREDWLFISASRTAIPKLIAAVESARTFLRDIAELKRVNLQQNGEPVNIHSAYEFCQEVARNGVADLDQLLSNLGEG